MRCCAGVCGTSPCSSCSRFLREVFSLQASRTLFKRPSINCADASTTNVMKKRISPISISEERRDRRRASVNSLAIVAEIVVPGANSDGWMWWALPMTKVTAIVSPSARPSASIAPPTTPAARKRQHDAPHHFPGRAAHSVGRFFERRRNRLEDVARHRRDERQNHDRQNQRGGEDADAVRRTREQVLQHRNIAEKARSAKAAASDWKAGANTKRPQMP